MGRPKKGWRLETRGDGIIHVRFTHDGRERQFTTESRDPVEAQERAARIYAEVVSGRHRPLNGGGRAAGPIVAVDELAAQWLADEESRLDELTIKQYVMYVRRWQSFFKTMERITPAGAEDFWRARLKSVKRKTVLKELSALRTFLDWCKVRGHIAEVPLVSAPSKRVTGTTSKQPHKAKAIVFEPAEMEAILGQLPEYSPPRGRAARAVYPVRACFEVAWETALRPATIAALRVPEDYRKGAATLGIRDEIDKARFGRELPLSAKARAALDRVCPDVGVIFGAHDHRNALRTAAKAAGLPPEKASRISAYDFRHSRLTHLGENTDNLAGLQYLAGHKHASTTSIYVHAGRKAAEKVLATAAGFSGDFRGVGVAKESEGVGAGPGIPRDSDGVRKAGVEPARFYPQEPEGDAEGPHARTSAGLARQSATESGTDRGGFRGLPENDLTRITRLRDVLRAIVAVHGTDEIGERARAELAVLGVVADA
jgi:integrase